MTPGAVLVALLGVGFVTAGTVRSTRGRRGPLASPLAVVGLVLVAASTAGVLGPGAPRWILPSAVLVTAGLVGVVGLCVGTLRDDAQLATAGYWVGCSSFAVPVALVGRDPPTVVAGTAVTLLLAAAYGALAQRTPASTATAGSRE